MIDFIVSSCLSLVIDAAPVLPFQSAAAAVAHPAAVEHAGGSGRGGHVLDADGAAGGRQLAAAAQATLKIMI